MKYPSDPETQEERQERRERIDRAREYRELVLADERPTEAAECGVEIPRANIHES